MSFATRNLHQDITVWSTTPDGFGGYEFTSPRHIKGRWNTQNERSTDAEGNEIISKAEVMLSDKVEVGDYIFKGISDEDDPSALKHAYTVKDYRENTDLRGLEMVRKAII